MMKIICPICQDPMYQTNPDGKKVKQRYIYSTALQPRHPKDFQLCFKTPVKVFTSANPDPNPIVASRCGHIFHKKCIMNYMRVFRTEMKRSGVECPCCKFQVILANQTSVDFLPSEKCTLMDERELRCLKAFNRELREQTRDLCDRLFTIEEKMKNALNKMPRDQCVSGMDKELKRAERKTKRAEIKALKANERLKKAEGNLQDLKQRAGRLESNWIVAQDTKIIQELIKDTKKMLKPKTKSKINYAGAGDISATGISKQTKN